ncbi:MAG TPA: hypothetical protein VF457_14345 [Burkholderiaceae bacterium]
MNEVEAGVRQSAERAVAALQARAAGRLDWTAASVDAVDEICAEVAGYVAELDEAVVTGLVQQLGCYLLEVARRRHGGTYYWHPEGEQPVLVVGEPQAHVALMTWSKVTGRVTGDEGDDLRFFLDGFAQRAARPEAGDRVLFV